jgi:hypothetical protein
VLTQQLQEPITESAQEHYYYYYLFTAIGFEPGGSGPYTTQLQQKT